ncbi:MAG: indole-3-glycerol phosphate synthase TrpC [Bernardetiaceae bacterium]|nr:indole-3-glycerol phosphate synthase TrpC [Bernardetiaceae bacterium]
MNILQKIVLHKQQEVKEAEQRKPIEKLKEEVFYNKKRKSLKAAIASNPHRAHIIAEFKRASPSEGAIHETADIKQVIEGYEVGGVSAISVLTDSNFFGAKSDDFMTAVNQATVPLLRKDFIISEYQLYESKAMGADIILLIAAILTSEQSQRLCNLAHKLGLEVLLELHSEAEWEAHQHTEADFFGINNRNLKDFSVSIETSLSLLKKLPADIIKISESGLSEPKTVLMLQKAGFQGFLMGTHFMKTQTPAQTAQHFIEQLRPLQWKVCGMREAQNIEEIAELKPDYLGFIFYEKSKRFVGENFCMPSLDKSIQKTGVFVNSNIDYILKKQQKYGLDILQLHGNESSVFCKNLKIKTSARLAKAISVGENLDIKGMQTYADSGVDFFVLDTKTAQYGGSGRAFDWELLQAYTLDTPFLLAGGITPQNIASAIAYAKAHKACMGIELNSGFEQSAALKDKNVIQSITNLLY